MKINWKIKLGAILLIISFLLYAFAYFSLNDPEEVIFYIIIDLAFIPLDILVVVLVVESIVNKKEKEAILEKLDMIMGAFFSEVGTSFLARFNSIDQNYVEIQDALKNIAKWNDNEYSKFLEGLDNRKYKFIFKLEDNERNEFFTDLKNFLSGKRDFLIRLLENPNLLEKDSFSNLLLAMFHLDEELERRKSFENMIETDYKHLLGDIDRVYSHLIYQWISYIHYLKKHYPYMFSIAIRTNPFNNDAEIQVKK